MGINKQIDQWNWIESRNRPVHIDNWFLYKETMAIQWRKDGLFKKWC